MRGKTEEVVNEDVLRAVVVVVDEARQEGLGASIVGCSGPRVNRPFSVLVPFSFLVWKTRQHRLLADGGVVYPPTTLRLSLIISTIIPHGQSKTRRSCERKGVHRHSDLPFVSSLELLYFPTHRGSSHLAVLSR